MYRKQQSERSGGSHADLILALVRFLQPRTYVELGVAQGETFEPVHREQISKGRFAVGCDLSIQARPIIGVDYGVKSLDFVRPMLDRSVDLAFIDADHRHDSVIADVMELSPKMAPNGIVLLHDTYPPNETYLADGYCSDSWRAAQTLHNQHGSYYESVTLAAEWGLTIIRFHGGRQLGWKPDSFLD